MRPSASSSATSATFTALQSRRLAWREALHVAFVVDRARSPSIQPKHSASRTASAQGATACPSRLPLPTRTRSRWRGAPPARRGTRAELEEDRLGVEHGAADGTRLHVWRRARILMDMRRAGWCVAAWLLVGVPAAQAADGLKLTARKQVNARLVELSFTTPALAEETGVYVLLPSGYSEHPTRRYPVLYLLHGAVDDYRRGPTRATPSRSRRARPRHRGDARQRAPAAATSTGTTAALRAPGLGDLPRRAAAALDRRALPHHRRRAAAAPSPACRWAAAAP